MLPEAPGVYLFYGDNPLPLYIGKSINLRERVGAHFSQDWRSETDLRLSQEIRRIEFEETAGELGALLREAVLIKSRLPAHNRALRRKLEAGVLEIVDGVPRFVAAAGIDCAQLSGSYGPFASRASARAALARTARRPPVVLRCGCGSSGARSGPCFARQLRRCDGACVGAESPASHDRAARRRARAAGDPALAGGGRWRSCANAAPTASAPTFTCFATGAGSAPRATTASSRRCVEAPQRAGVRSRRHAAAACGGIAPGAAADRVRTRPRERRERRTPEHV